MNSHKQQGLSMIEVLVALFILAIGIMGQMAMQMTSLSSSQSSYYRSQAASIANDFADRIRLNADGAQDPNVNYDDVTIDAANTHNKPQCGSSGCDLANQVRLDIYEIQQNLKASIPSGGLTLKRLDISTTPIYRITINWSAEDRAGLVNSDEINQLIVDFGI